VPVRVPQGLTHGWLKSAALQLLLQLMLGKVQPKARVQQGRKHLKVV